MLAQAPVELLRLAADALVSYEALRLDVYRRLKKRALGPSAAAAMGSVGSGAGGIEAREIAGRTPSVLASVALSSVAAEAAADLDAGSPADDTVLSGTALGWAIGASAREGNELGGEGKRGGAGLVHNVFHGMHMVSQCRAFVVLLGFPYMAMFGGVRSIAPAAAATVSYILQECRLVGR